MKSSRNIGTEDDGVLVTSGAQQIMDLFTKSILNEGETVICEAPSFIGSLNDFRSYKAKLVGIPMDTDGMNMEALEKALETEKNVKFIYTIPNFQNPSGITMSLEKRHRLYELAKAHDVMILEDNPYGDLYYEGEPLRASSRLIRTASSSTPVRSLRSSPRYARGLRHRPKAGSRQNDRLQAGAGRAHEYLVAGSVLPLHDGI